MSINSGSTNVYHGQRIQDIRPYGDDSVDNNGAADDDDTTVDSGAVSGAVGDDAVEKPFKMSKKRKTNTKSRAVISDS